MIGYHGKHLPAAGCPPLQATGSEPDELAGVPLKYGFEAGQLMQAFTFVVVCVSICLTAFLLPQTTRAKADLTPHTLRLTHHESPLSE